MTKLLIKIIKDIQWIVVFIGGMACGSMIEAGFHTEIILVFILSILIMNFSTPLIQFLKEKERIEE